MTAILIITVIVTVITWIVIIADFLSRRKENKQKAKYVDLKAKILDAERFSQLSQAANEVLSFSNERLHDTSVTDRQYLTDLRACIIMKRTELRLNKISKFDPFQYYVWRTV